MRRPIPFGRFLMLDRIAIGGMAEVFAAKTFEVAGVERLVAIKRILPNMVEDDEFITMFIDEARIAAQLSHANIVQIHELGQHDDTYYIAMEYVSGQDVRSLREKLAHSKQPFPIGMAVLIAAQIAEGLDYAHAKTDGYGQPLGIIHRDISPHNVLVSYDGEVKIIDFGIAKAAGRIQKTQAGILKGKFSYMSPEQVRGLEIDHRSDIFSAGVMLFEMLTSTRLFRGESDLATLEMVRDAKVPSPRERNPEIPEALEQIMLKALAADRDQRYQRAGDLHDDLLRFLFSGFSGKNQIYSTRRLGEFMREAFSEEFKQEKIRIRRWWEASAEDAKAGGTPEDLSRQKIRIGSQPQADDDQKTAVLRVDGSQATPASTPSSESVAGSWQISKEKTGATAISGKHPNLHDKTSPSAPQPDPSEDGTVVQKQEHSHPGPGAASTDGDEKEASGEELANSEAAPKDPAAAAPHDSRAEAKGSQTASQTPSAEPECDDTDPGSALGLQLGDDSRSPTPQSSTEGQVLVRRGTGSSNTGALTSTPASPRTKRGPSPVALLTALILLGLASFFTVKYLQQQGTSASSPAQGLLIIKVFPETAQVLLSDEPITLPFRQQLSPGEYELQASAPGYETQSQPFDLRAGEKRTVSLELRSLDSIATPTAHDPLEDTGQDSSDTSTTPPPGSSKSASTRQRPGDAPSAAATPQAEASKQGSGEGRDSESAAAQDSASDLLKADGGLNEETATGPANADQDGSLLELDLTPEELEALGLGDGAGRPRIIEVGESESESEFTDDTAKKDTEPHELKVEAVADPDPELQTQARLVARCHPPAKVFVNGKDTQRRTPINDDAPILLPPGQHEIACVSDEGKQATQSIELEAGEIFQFRADL